MKILFFQKEILYDKGGSGTHSLRLARELKSRDHEIFFAARDATKEFTKEFKFFKTPKDSKIPVVHDWVDDTRIGKFLAEKIKENNIELLYGFMTDAIPATAVAHQKAGCKAAVELHGSYFEEMRKSKAMSIPSFISKKIEYDFFKNKVPNFVAICPKLKELVSKEIKGARFFVNTSGFNPEEINPQIKPSEEVEELKKKNSIVVMYVGNFNPYQGIQTLFDAAKIVLKKDSNFIFVLVGNYKKFPQYSEFIEKNGFEEKIFLFDSIPNSQVPGFLAASDILVIPRPSNPITENAFPSKLPYYLGAGKAVIATDVGITREIIKNKENGLIVKPDSVAELTNAILELKNKELRKKISKNAFNSVVEKFSWEKIADNAERIFKSLK